MELPARGVEGTLFVFPAVVDQRSAILVDYIADEFFGGYLSQRRGLVHVADDLSAEKPPMVDVVLDGSFGQTGLGEVKEEGMKYSTSCRPMGEPALPTTSSPF